MAQKIVAFVAKSFDPADEAKIDPIIKFLDSFSKLGFITQTAEQSEVESVSVRSAHSSISHKYWSEFLRKGTPCIASKVVLQLPSLLLGEH